MESEGSDYLRELAEFSDVGEAQEFLKMQHTSVDYAVSIFLFIPSLAITFIQGLFNFLISIVPTTICFAAGILSSSFVNPNSTSYTRVSSVAGRILYIANNIIKQHEDGTVSYTAIDNEGERLQGRNLQKSLDIVSSTPASSGDGCVIWGPLLTATRFWDHAICGFAAPIREYLLVNLSCGRDREIMLLATQLRIVRAAREELDNGKIADRLRRSWFKMIVCGIFTPVVSVVAFTFSLPSITIGVVAVIFYSSFSLLTGNYSRNSDLMILANRNGMAIFLTIYEVNDNGELLPRTNFGAIMTGEKQITRDGIIPDYGGWFFNLFRDEKVMSREKARLYYLVLLFFSGFFGFMNNYFNFAFGGGSLEVRDVANRVDRIRRGLRNDSPVLE
ncbi:MAG: hypothetical protein LBJ93_01980 [Clostridiales bacterium]|nr:hypothetical protein [Clostridiales bacterium]